MQILLFIVVVVVAADGSGSGEGIGVGRCHAAFLLTPSKKRVVLPIAMDTAYSPAANRASLSSPA